MTTYTISPVLSWGQFSDSNGNPLNGGKLFCYLAGSSSVLSPTYTNNTGSPIENPNPIVLDSAGRLPVSVWLPADVSCHLVLTTSAGVIVEEFDYVTGAPSSSAVQGLIDASLTGYLLKTGGAITGNLSVSGTSSLGTTTVGTFTAGASTLGVTTATSVTGALNANSTVVSNVATPVAATDAANKTYVDSTTSAALPAGMVIYSASATVPSGWLEANGASLLRASYPALYTAIGTTYGFADGTHFNLPDLRGYFIRGYDDGRGVDSGRVFGSNQADDNKSHTHGLNGQLNNFSLDNIPFFGLTPSGTSDDTGLMDASGSESRPKNIAMLPLIKT
mgnify:CR=1 FL=1